MIDVIPARPFMAERMQLQSAQALTGQAMTPETVALAIGGGVALAAVEDGQVFGMAGIYEMWPDRGMAWALLSPGAGRYMTVIHRLTKRALDVSTFRRVEAYVVEDHPEGHRWMRLLGFEKEGLMRQFWQSRDFILYAKVR